MKIEARFKIGDEVFLIEDNKVFSGIVKCICVNVTVDDVEQVTFISYGVNGKTLNDYYSAERLFATKEELLKSL